MVATAAAPLLMGAIFRMQFDVVPAALMLGGVLLLARERPASGAAWLGVGTMTKVFPALGMPVALAWLAGAGRRSDAWRALGAFAAVVLVVAGIAAMLSLPGLAAAARFQLDRPVQVESAQATVVVALSRATGQVPGTSPSHGSVGFVSRFGEPVGWAFLALLAVTLAALVWLALRAGRQLRKDPPGSRAAMALALLGSVMAFAALGRVISPQYMIWLVPLLGLAAALREWWVAGSVALTFLLTLVEFPAFYQGVVSGDVLATIILAWRNIALLTALALTLVVLLQRVRDLERTPG
jgi:hypothetical protein